jgi:hypothetical protein
MQRKKPITKLNTITQKKDEITKNSTTNKEKKTLLHLELHAGT